MTKIENYQKEEFSPCAFCQNSSVRSNLTPYGVIFSHACFGFPRGYLDPGDVCLSRRERLPDADGKRTVPITDNLPSKP